MDSGLNGGSRLDASPLLVTSGIYVTEAACIDFEGRDFRTDC